MERWRRKERWKEERGRWITEEAGEPSNAGKRIRGWKMEEEEEEQEEEEGNAIRSRG